MGNDRNPNWLTQANWKPDYTEILILTGDGRAPSEIHDQTGLSVNTIARVQKSHFFQEKLRNIQIKTRDRFTESIAKTKIKQVLGNHIDEARKLINEAAKDAATKMIELAQNGGGGKIQFAACKDILDRSGLKPIEIVETRERVFSPDEVERAKLILEESQDIVTRLSNKPSPFIRQVSSATDESSNGKDSIPADTPDAEAPSTSLETVV